MFFGLVLVLFISLGVFGQTQTVTTLGTGTFVVPSGVTIITVEVWGGGGRGGSRTNNSGNSGAGGGGGGAYSRGVLSVSPGQTLNYNVGAGAITDVNPGVDSYFGSTTTVMAKGGGSVNINSDTGASGGLAPAGFGDVRFSGGNGANGTNAFSGGGGSSAGESQDGNLGIGFTGGFAPADGGKGENGLDENGFGTNAIQLAGGGSGAFRKSGGTDLNGGNGGNGRIEISWSTINLTSATNSINQNICLGSAMTPITYNITGVNSVQFINLPAGVSGTFSGGNINIAGIPSNTGVFEYEIVLQVKFNELRLSGTISVPENMNSDSISVDTFCVGTALSNVFQSTFRNTGIGTITNLPPGIIASWNNGQIEFSGVPTNSGTWEYFIDLTGGCGSPIETRASGVITVNDVVSIISPNLGTQSNCVGTPFTPLSVGSGSGFNFQWFENISPDTNGIAIPDAENPSYSPPSNMPGTKYYYVVLSGACGTSLTSPVSGAIVTTPGNTVSAASTEEALCVNQPLTQFFHSTTGATGIINNGVSGANGLPPGVRANFSLNQITVQGTPTIPGEYNYSILLTGGCGTVNVTGTITVSANSQVITPSLGGQARCNDGSPFNAISVGAGTGLTYQWYRNSANNITFGTSIDGATSNTYIPENSGVGDSYYYVEVSSLTCGGIVKSEVSGLFRVNPLPLVTFIEEPTGTFCVGLDVTYRTQAGQSKYTWLIPGVSGIDYVITSGGTTTSNFVTLQWKTPGTKSVSVSHDNVNGCTVPNLTKSSNTTVQIGTVTAPSVNHPSACFVNRTIAPITHNTTLVTGIGNPETFGLPLGLSAIWNSGTITISGTVDASVPPNIYNYDIPLTGGCGTVSAKGFIDVQPQYQISFVASVAPSNPGVSARITVNGSPSLLTNGTYEVSYTIGLANTGIATATLTIQNGRGTFNTLPIANDQLTSLTITQIKKATDACFVPISNNNETFFGFGELPFANNGIFYVPAGIFEITVKIFGGGGGGGRNDGGGGGGGGYSSATIAVRPGQMIFINVGRGGTGQTNGSAAQNGTASYVSFTENPQNSASTSFVYVEGGIAGNGPSAGAGTSGNVTNGLSGQNGGSNVAGSGGKGGFPNSNGGPAAIGNNGDGSPGTLGGGGGGARGNGTGGQGGNGLVSISYGLPPVDPCFRVIDDGSRTGLTIIEFTCDAVWQAPEGLAEFTVTAIGGGGGGGKGNAAGGGGAGGYVRTTVNADPAFVRAANSNFDIAVGQGGSGDTSTLMNIGGANGGLTSFNGVMDNINVTISTTGGGGGGSTNSPNSGAGVNGASGGGGAFNGIRSGDQLINNGGNGTTGYSGGGSEVKIFPNDANKGAAAGGGGGGAQTAGIPGSASGSGNANGGNGGAGLSFIIGDSTYYYGGGGGGNGYNFEANSQQQAPGLGGLVSGIRLGGNGSVIGLGGNGLQRTGSGAGSGTMSGGNGGSGRVFITYPVFRILPVD